jgi:hypothetical protein
MCALLFVALLVGIARLLNSNINPSFCLQGTLALLLMIPTKHVKDFRIWELSLSRNQMMVTFFWILYSKNPNILCHECIISISKCYGCFLFEICHTVDNYLNYLRSLLGHLFCLSFCIIFLHRQNSRFIDVFLMDNMCVCVF